MRHILIFDSDAGFREGIAWCLRTEGYRVLTASARTEALRIMLVVPTDLLLLDVGMPVREGYMLLRHMAEHERLSPIPVVVVTRTPERAPAGMVVLTKPFAPELLIGTVAGILSMSRRRSLTPASTPAVAARDPIMSNAALTEIKT